MVYAESLENILQQQFPHNSKTKDIDSENQEFYASGFRSCQISSWWLPWQSLSMWQFCQFMEIGSAATRKCLRPRTNGQWAYTKGMQTLNQESCLIRKGGV